MGEPTCPPWDPRYLNGRGNASRLWRSYVPRSEQRQATGRSLIARVLFGHF
jgi:hypothetical protein